LVRRRVCRPLRFPSPRHFLVDTDSHPVSNRGYRGPAVPGHRVLVSSGKGAAAWCCGREGVRIAERTGEKR